MFELIIFIIFVISFGGVAFILARKVPVLVDLPRNGKTGFKKHRLILDAEEKIKNIFVSFEKQIYLHKALSWLKCQILKLETQIDHSLHNIRKKAQQTKKTPKK